MATIENRIIDMFIADHDFHHSGDLDAEDRRRTIQTGIIKDWGAMMEMLYNLDRRLRGTESGYCIDLSDDDMAELQILVDRMTGLHETQDVV